MNDIEFAFGASPEIGRLYKDGKSFSIDTPVLALSFLRGLAAAFCNCLDHDLIENTLDRKIASLEQQGMLKPAVKRQLRTLQINGNKAAHPESYDFVDLNFPDLAAEALIAARILIKHLYIYRHEPVPEYEVIEIESGDLKDMCIRAMIGREIEAMNQAGEYFKEKAEQYPNICVPLYNGYPYEAQQDITQAMFWFEQGANQSHPNCLYQYGHYLAEQGEEQEGKHYIERAAELDHPDALFYVAQKTLDGLEGWDKDATSALELFERAARLGNLAALSQLGAMHADGFGCEVDLALAAEYTLTAAQAGVPQAQYNLHLLYMNGLGLDKNEGDAIKWLIEAASQDYPIAIYDLACLIKSGMVPGRSVSDAEAEFVRAMSFPEFRAQAAISAAEIFYDCTSLLPELMRAAQYLQACFAQLSIDGDPANLRNDCLLACSKIVGRLRQHINANGPDHSLKLADIFASALFDRNFIPVIDASARQAELARMMLDYGPTALNQIRTNLFREACLEPRNTHQRNGPITTLHPAPTIPKLGRNELCHCGSRLKFKKCCARGV